MKKWLIIYILLIILIAFFIKSTDRQYRITDIKLSSYKTELKKDNPNISDEEVKQELESKIFWQVLKKSFLISTGIIAFAFIMTGLRNGFIVEFFHL